MADVSDVENRMVGLIADSLLLGSNYLPGSVASSDVARTQCRIYRGWPIAKALSDDIAAGISNITVFPVAGASRRTTRYFPQWNPQPAAPLTLSATVSGPTVTFSGTTTGNQVIGIRFGDGVNPNVYTYRPLITDSGASIAVAFAGMILHSTPTGPVLTIPTNSTIQTIVAADQAMWLETRRQEQNVWVIGWCPTPSDRDTVMTAVDEGFANLLDPYGHITDQFPLPDGSSARLLYLSNHTDDQAQRQGIWRRDLRYTVSYPTTMIQAFPTMIFGTVNTTDDTSTETFTVTVGPTES